MHRVLIVDSNDFKRRFVSVDLTPNPMPLLKDLCEKARIEAAACDTVLFSDGDDDPVILKSRNLNLGPYPWKRLEALLGGVPGPGRDQQRERHRSTRLERGTTA